MTSRLLKLLFIALSGLAMGQAPELLNTEGTQLDSAPKKEAFREAINAPAITDLGWLDVTKPPYNAALNWNGLVGAGATGTDDTAAIQAAIDDAKTGNIKTVFIPGKAYITEALVINSLGVQLVGRGYFSDAIYQHTASEHCISMQDRDVSDNNDQYERGVRRLRLYGRGAGTSTGTGIHCDDPGLTGGSVYNGSRLLIESCWVGGFATGIDIQDWDNWRVSDCVVLANGRGIYTEAFTNTAVIERSNFGSNSVRSFHVGEGSNLSLKHIDCGNEPQFLFMEANSRCSIEDCNFETDGGTAPTYKGAFEMSNSCSLYLNNVQSQNNASALPGVYMGGVGFLGVGEGGFRRFNNGTGKTVYRESTSSVVRWGGPLLYADTTAVQTFDGSNKFVTRPPGTMQQWSEGGLDTPSATNRGEFWYVPTGDDSGTLDTWYASVRGANINTYTAEKFLNRDLTGGNNTWTGTNAFSSATFSLTNLPTYADNAAATSGGLAAGRLYRTATGVLMVRY